MSSEDEDERKLCKYGESCYQKNPQHHRRFKHPKRKTEDVAENIEKKQKLETSSNENLMKEQSPQESIVNKEIPENSLNGSTHDDSSNFIDLSSIDDLKNKVETVFLVKMPNDFFSFFDFCESLDKENPKKALTAAGLYLVGPFDIINKSFTIDQTAALQHYRYYYDPPEFQTVLKCDDKNMLHYGYYRDNPKEEPVFVASNETNVDCKLNIISENLFSAVNVHLEKIKKTADPFKKMKIKKIQDALHAWSKKNGFNLDSLTKKMRDRRSKVVAKTFHGAGIVVPYDKKTELGYRELKENDATLKKMLNNLVEADTEEERKEHWGKLQPVLTYANIANDECDFGTGLQLGLDLFCFGHDMFHKAVLQILKTSYNLLGRSEFATILTAHLKNRKKEENCTLPV